MLQVTPQMRILVAYEPCDFRKGIDGMAARCRQTLGEDPFSGALYVFRNRTGTALKILVYDGQGFWLCHKRFSEGRFRKWPTGQGTSRNLESYEFSLLLFGGDVTSARAAPMWRRLREPHEKM